MDDRMEAWMGERMEGRMKKSRMNEWMNDE